MIRRQLMVMAVGRGLLQRLLPHLRIQDINQEQSLTSGAARSAVRGWRSYHRRRKLCDSGGLQSPPWRSADDAPHPRSRSRASRRPFDHHVTAQKETQIVFEMSFGGASKF